MKTPLLNDRDLEVLDALRTAADEHIKAGLPDWVTPNACGGSNGSDHSYRLIKCVHNGMAEQKDRPGATSYGSKVYRITDKGRALLKARREQV